MIIKFKTLNNHGVKNTPVVVNNPIDNESFLKVD